MALKKHIGWLIFLLGFIACYWRVFPGDFHYDDYHSIRWNTWLVSLGNTGRFFLDPSCFSADPQARMYRPILLLSYALDYQVYGWRSWGWHLSNLLLHFFNCLLFFQILLRIFQNRTASWLGMLLFAFHPVSGENINYLNCRSSLLLVFLVFAGLICFLSWLENNKKSPFWFLLFNIFFILALFTKSAGVVFPGICLLGFFLLDFPGENRGKKFLMFFLPQIFLILGYLAVRKMLFGGILYAYHLPRPVWVNFITELKAYFWYLGLVLFPHQVSIEHSLKESKSLFEPGSLLSFIGLIMLFAFLLRAFLRKEKSLRILAFFLGGYLVCLAPTSSIIPLNVLVSERALYPALWGICGIFTSGFFWLWERKKIPTAICLGLILVSYFSLNWKRAYIWQKEELVFKEAMRWAPDNPRVLAEWGRILAESGEKRKAIKYLTRAYQLLPDSGSSVFNLGNVYFDLGELGLAKKYFKKAIELNPRDAQARVNLALIYQLEGKLELARWELEQAIKVSPGLALAHNNLGDLFRKMGRDDLAEQEFQRALELEPGLGIAHYNLGLLYKERGDYEKALAHFKKAYEFAPANPDISLQLAVVYLKIAQPGEAEKWARKALAIDSKLARAWYYLALAQKEQGKREKAIESLENARAYLSLSDRELKAELDELEKELNPP